MYVLYEIILIKEMNHTNDCYLFDFQVSKHSKSWKIKTQKTFEYNLCIKSKGIVTTHNFQNK